MADQSLTSTKANLPQGTIDFDTFKSLNDITRAFDQTVFSFASSLSAEGAENTDNISANNNQENSQFGFMAANDKPQQSLGDFINQMNDPSYLAQWG